MRTSAGDDDGGGDGGKVMVMMIIIINIIDLIGIYQVSAKTAVHKLD